MAIPKLREFKTFRSWSDRARDHGRVKEVEPGYFIAYGDRHGIGAGEFYAQRGWLSGYLVGIPKVTQRLLSGWIPGRRR